MRISGDESRQRSSGQSLGNGSVPNGGSGHCCMEEGRGGRMETPKASRHPGSQTPTCRFFCSPPTLPLSHSPTPSGHTVRIEQQSLRAQTELARPLAPCTHLGGSPVYGVHSRHLFHSCPSTMSTSKPASLFLRPALILLVPLSVLLTGCGGPNLFERLSRPWWGFWGTVVVVLDLVALVDLLGDEARGTASTVIWALLIVFFPVGGVILYFLLGRE